MLYVMGKFNTQAMTNPKDQNGNVICDINMFDTLRHCTCQAIEILEDSELR